MMYWPDLDQKRIFLLPHRGRSCLIFFLLEWLKCESFSLDISKGTLIQDTIFSRQKKTDRARKLSPTQLDRQHSSCCIEINLDTQRLHIHIHIHPCLISIKIERHPLRHPFFSHGRLKTTPITLFRANVQETIFFFSSAWVKMSLGTRLSEQEPMATGQVGHFHLLLKRLGVGTTWSMYYLLFAPSSRVSRDCCFNKTAYRDVFGLPNSFPWRIILCDRFSSFK